MRAADWTLLGLLALAGCERTSLEPADLILYGGTIVTLEEAERVSALAVTGPYITALGDDAEVLRHADASTERIDLDGRTVIPGLIEGHGHFLGLGRSKLILDLRAAESFAGVVQQVAIAADAAPEGAWIFGRGWHQDKWRDGDEIEVDGVPVNRSLNAVSPDNPVLLGHASGHAAYANDAALAAAGIDDRTADPPGGTIVRDEQGRATGLLRETAQRLVNAAAEAELAASPPEEREALFEQYVQLAGEEALAYGITSFHDAGASFDEIAQFRRMEAQGTLPIRLYVMVRGETNEVMRNRLAEVYQPFEGNDYLTVRSIKRQIDGALGAHGAWLEAPYTDLPSTSGLVLESVEDIEETARIAAELGFQVNTHAIGTRANREVLDLYERVWKASEVEGTDLRWRIEHAQHVNPPDIPRFAELGVIASIQGVHCTSDGPWIPVRLGAERTELTSYRWRDLLDSGARVANGTDVPVESIDPFASIHASVSRKMASGAVFFGNQAMTPMEALRSYTIGNAYAAFEEDVKGSLRIGKLADLAVLSQNILTVDSDAIPETRVDYTIVGGEVRYQRKTPEAE